MMKVFATKSYFDAVKEVGEKREVKKQKKNIISGTLTPEATV